MYFLVRGELEVLTSLESSTRIATLGVGEFVGEAALVDAQPRVCFVRAATTVKLSHSGLGRSCAPGGMSWPVVPPSAAAARPAFRWAVERRATTSRLDEGTTPQN